MTTKNFYKDSTTGVFFVGNDVLPASNYRMNFYKNDTVVSLIDILNNEKPVMDGIEITNLLKESGSAYTDRDDLLLGVKDFFSNASGDGGILEGSVNIYADLPIADISNNGLIYYVVESSGGSWIKTTFNFYQYPKGFYISDGVSWTKSEIQVKVSEDATSVVNINDWSAYVSTNPSFDILDRIIYNNITYTNLSGVFTSNSPNIDTTNWKDIEPNNITEPFNIGQEANGNYLKIEEDGTWVNEGDGSTWDDIVNSLIGRRLYSTQGTIDYDYNENAMILSDDGDINNINDRVVFNLQYPHRSKSIGTMNLHIHWEQANAINREFTVQYRVQSNGQPKTTSWTSIVSNSNVNSVFSYTSGTINQITRLVDVDMIGAGISATVQFRLTRSDSNGGTILGTFVDAHVESDMSGSREEFVK